MKGRVIASFSQEEKPYYSEEKSFEKCEKETTYESEDDFAFFDLFGDLEEQNLTQPGEGGYPRKPEPARSDASQSVQHLPTSQAPPERGGSALSAPICLHSDFFFVDASYNVQGNYSDYVSKALQSLLGLRYINYSHIIEEKKNRIEQAQNGKKTLILDLDETLIHSDLDNRLPRHDHVITFTYEDHDVHIPINFRPGLQEFLKAVSENFEVVVFTASKQEYADVILNFLDPGNTIFKKRLYRESCINVENKVFIKDLRILNRKLEDMVIVDNSLYAFANQLSNGILINSFYDDQEDTELSNLLSYLQQYIHNAPDVRCVNESIFSFRTILEGLSKFQSE